MRRQDWLGRLLEYVEEIRQSPYDPVKHNCALFVNGAVQQMTDEAPAERMGLTVSSLRDVAEVLDRYGGVRGLCEAAFGAALQPLLARRGDVVIKEGTEGETLGVCMGQHALFLGPDGLQPRKLSECLNCWRVE